MPNQPTILVKKANGTSVRLTLEEFKEYIRTTTAEAGSRPHGGTKLSRLSGVPPHGGDGIPSLTAGRNAKKNNDFKWSVEDHRSLLEEKNEEVKQKPAAESLPSTRDDICARVVKELKFPISDELRPRLQSLIVSRIKDIRSDEQADAYALREVKNGGLGLNAAQAGELLEAVRKVLRLPADVGLEEKRKIETSNKLIIKPASNSAGQFSNKPMTQPANNAAAKKTDANKQVINDIVPSAKQTVGPVEELADMTLINFRRLAADPSVAGKVLLEKFKELETESYLLYLDAIKAWRQSPLYRQYLAAMTEAINQRQRISALLAGNSKEQLKENEFITLVEVNGHL